MIRYPVFTPQGIYIREAGPGESGKVVETITADDLLALKRMIGKPTEAATPDPGGLDVEAEIERLRDFHQDALNRYNELSTPISPKYSPPFLEAVAAYLGDLESRRKPAEPSGWPEVVVTSEDVERIYACTLKSGEGLSDESWNQAMAKAIQEWLDSKPRPKPVVAGTPESVELTREQFRMLRCVYNEHDDNQDMAAVNLELRGLGLGLHRLDPKPSAEPDPGDTATPTEADSQEIWRRDMLAKSDRLDMLRANVDAQLLMLSADFAKLRTKVNSIAETVAVVPIMDRKLDAIAERLDGPKVVTEFSGVSAGAIAHAIQSASTFEKAGKALIDGLAKHDLIVIRKPEGDPS